MRPAPPRIGRRAVRPLARRPDRLRARRATVAADPHAAANKRVGAPRSRRAAAIRQAAAALAARARAARRARPVGRAGAEPNDDRHGANGGQCAPRVGWPGGQESRDAGSGPLDGGGATLARQGHLARERRRHDGHDLARAPQHQVARRGAVQHQGLRLRLGDQPGPAGPGEQPAAGRPHDAAGDAGRPHHRDHVEEPLPPGQRAAGE